MLATVTTAHEARSRYDAMLATNSVVQHSWHGTAEDGRELACMLGVLGSKVDGPSRCPATVMPKWLAQAVPHLFDGQPADKALAWGAAFYAELDRLNGDVPFAVFHRWMAEAVLPLSRRSALARPHPTTDGCVAAVDVMIGLHANAAEGGSAQSAAWSAAESAARSAARSAAESAAESAARSAAESAAESAARSAAESAAQSAAWSAAESAAESAARSAAESAAESAARSAAWSAAVSEMAGALVRILATVSL